MVITISASLHASATEFARPPPLAASFSLASAFRSKPATACPALSRFCAIGRPILPSPMKPLLPTPLPTPVVFRASRRFSAGAHRREPQIHAEQPPLYRNPPHVPAVD